MAKYDPLRDHLAERTGPSVTLSLSEIDSLVGGLPASAKTSGFWANDSKGQARAWRSAGWHVESRNLNAERIVFARGEVGGTMAAKLTKVGGSPEARVSIEPPDAMQRICPVCNTAMPVSLVCDYCA
jgi:hypothetical protein